MLKQIIFLFEKWKTIPFTRLPKQLEIRITSINYSSSLVKHESVIKPLDLAAHQQASKLKSELGTAQQQIVWCLYYSGQEALYKL